ncbi:cobalamin biosynthesis protein [Streptomyces sp. NPDC097619]|uniref:cobalamin biosynthesis protein n=1 Tax=Streptomyces sp. NPDC097619 TaxID=3157228 RepID=UPI003321C35B
MTGGADPTRVVVGVGARGGVSAEEVCALVEGALRGAGLPRAAVTALATVDARSAEAGLLGAAERFGVPLLGYPAGVLAGVPVPHPSARVRSATGTPSVAEAAALAGGGRLLVSKTVSARATCAVATAPGPEAPSPAGPAPVAAPAAVPAPGAGAAAAGGAEGAALVDLAVKVTGR